MLLAAGCASPDATAPTPGQPPLEFPVGSSGGSQTDASSALIGSWRRFDVLTADNSTDIVTQTTEWRFDATSSCTRTITTFDAVEGIPRGSSRSCTWELGLQAITLTFGDGSVNTFSLTFAAFDPDRLVLDGFEYQRTS